MKTIIIIGVIALILVFFIAQYNRLIRLNISVNEAWAQIEVQLKRRADLIPNLVETVKGYAKHEQSTFDAVVAARAKATSASTVADVAAADGMVTQALRGLLAVAEAYPDLKASANFLSLQEELSTTEPDTGDRGWPVIRGSCHGCFPGRVCRFIRSPGSGGDTTYRDAGRQSGGF